MAGSVVELVRKALAADFRTIDPQRTHVLLVEAGPPEFDIGDLESISFSCP